MATHAHGTQTYSHLDPSVLPIPRVSIERVEGDIELIQGERDLEDKDERKLNDYLRGKTIWDLRALYAIYLEYDMIIEYTKTVESAVKEPLTLAVSRVTQSLEMAKARHEAAVSDLDQARFNRGSARELAPRELRTEYRRLVTVQLEQMANALSNLRREKGLHKTLTAVAAERITDGLVKLGHMAYHDFRTRINNLYHTGSGDRVRLKYFDETHIPARPSDQDQRHIIYTPSGLEMRLPDYNPPNSDTVAADHELSKTRFHAVARRHFLA